MKKLGILFFTSLLFSFDYNIYLMRTSVFVSIFSYFYNLDKGYSNLIDFEDRYSISLGIGTEKNFEHKKRNLHNIYLSYNKNTEVGEVSFRVNYVFNKNILFSADIVPFYLYKFNNINFYFGVGIAFINKTFIDNREKSTKFQFSDNLKVEKKISKYYIGYRFTHLSNLDIDTPNKSIDLNQIYFKYKF